MLFKAALACEQAVYSRHKLASANHRDFLMELAFQVIYIELATLGVRSTALPVELSSQQGLEANTSSKYINDLYSSKKCMYVWNHIKQWGSCYNESSLTKIVLSPGQTRMQVDASWQTRVCMDLQGLAWLLGQTRTRVLHASRWEFTGYNRVKMNLTCGNEFNL